MSVNNKTTTEPLSEYAEYEAMQNLPAEEEQSEYDQYEASFAEQSKANQAALNGEPTDYVRSASKAVKPIYQNAIDKVNTLFNANEESTTPANKALRLQDKAAILKMNVNDVKAMDDKSVDLLISRKRAQEAAAKYPDFVNKADQKSLEQIFVNPKAVNQINNSAKARAMGANTFEKFINTNKASALSMRNNAKFLAPGGDFKTWAMNHALISAERKANTITTEGTAKINKMWDEYEPFGDSPTSFYDIAKYITTDLEGFKAAFAEASNSAVSIALSIGGRTAGMAAGIPLGPAGVIAGGQAGAFLGGAIAAGDEYIQNEIDTNYTDINGEVNYKALEADIDTIKNKWRIEYGEQAIIGGAVEMFAPKILTGAGKGLGRVATKAPAVFKTATVKALAKAGKFTGKAGKTVGKVATKGAEEFIGEAGGAAAPKTLIDFQNGRLDKNKVFTNLKEGVREGVAGAITAGTLSAGKIATSKTLNTVLNADDAPTVEATPEAAPSSKPEGKTYDAEFTNTTESKPHNERTPEEAAASEYKTAQAEETLELTAVMDDDADAAEQLEGMTDQEKVALIDSANTPSTTTEDGVVVEGTPTEVIVNGADIETLLGEDVSVLQEVLVQERQVELAQAINDGENFKFTYGEWVVAASKLKDKHPTINHLPINTETEMPGYEAVSHLSEVLDLFQSQYDSLTVPSVESTPPSLPGISAEMTADANPAAIGARRQTGVVKAVTPTGNMNRVTLTLIDGSTHTIDLYDKESAQDIQGIADKLSAQFDRALKASGMTTDTVRQASLQGIPVIMRVLVKRSKALGKPISEMAKSISFKSDASSGSAYIGTTLGSDKVVYGVGRSAQRVSTVAHEFAHAILQFMTIDGPELEAQKQAGTITPEGIEYLTASEATAKLLGLKDVSRVDDFSPTSLINPTNGNVLTRNQGGGILTERTVTHEKLATTMEVFLKEGQLKTDAMETEIAQILLYWRALIPLDVIDHKASVAAVKGWGWSGAGEYYQALDPSSEVGNVFHTMYAVNQQIDKTTVPMFNFSYFPVEILGKGGQLILDKVIASKHAAIAKVFAKVYADSINARTAINTPEAIAKMNKDLAEAYGITYSGELVNSLSNLGLKIPESMSKELSNIQELMQRYNADKVPFFRDANEQDMEVLLSEHNDAIDAGDSIQTVISRMVGTFDTTKVDIYQKNLEDLGYVTDDKIKQASEEMLAKALPGILNDQFTQLVAAYPTEAKQLFAAYIKNGKVSSRMANKHVTIAAQNNLDVMTVKDLRIKALIKSVRDSSTEVVNYFNQGKYIDALIAKYDELTKSEMLRLAPDLIKQVESSTKALQTYGSLDYVYANAGKVHPETMQYLRDVLNNVAAKTPVSFDPIENMDADINAFVEGITERMLSNIAGKKLDSVAVIIELGQYAKIMAKVAAAMSQLEKENREFTTSTKVNKAKVAILKSTKIWDMHSYLPQANSVHEVFSTYFSSEAAYQDSAISGTIYKIINGEAQATNGAGEVAAKLQKLAKKSLSKKRKLDNMTLPNSGLKVESRDELLGVLLYMGSESGRETFMRTHGLVNIDPITGTATLKDAELQKDLDDLVAQGVLSVDDMVLVNAVWAEFVPMLKMIQEVYRRDRGVQVGEIKSTPFKVGGHDLTGGYFPISYNEVMKVGTDVKAEAMFYNVFGLKTFSRTKERGEGKSEPVKLGLSPITSYVNMVMREYYIIPEMRLFEAFVNDPQVNEHLQLTRPGALKAAIKAGPATVVETGIINDWVSTVKNQVRSDIDPNTSKIINWILRNTSFVFYSFDAISAVTNTVAGIPAAAPYSSSKMRLALNALTWPLTIRRGNKRAHLSEMMKANEHQFIQFVLSENTEELYSNLTTTKDFMAKTAMMLQQVSQHVLERLIWNTEYEAQMARGATSEYAIKKADLVTERALGRYALSNKSLGQKAGVFGRFTNIATQHLTTFKRQYNVEMKRDGSNWRKAFMSSMIIGAALTSSMVALELQDWATPDRPDEDEEKKNLKMKVQTASEMIPYFLGPYGRILSTIINQGIKSDISISPVEHTLKKVARGGYNAMVTSGTDYQMGARDYADVFGMLTMFTGVPFSGIANVNDFATAFRDHDEMMIDRLIEDAERAAYARQFGIEYNPLID